MYTLQTIYPHIFFLTTKRTTQASILARALILTLLLTGCAQGRSDLTWEATITPTLICQGDAVTLAWDLGQINRCIQPGELWPSSSACLDPVRVAIHSTPEQLLIQPIARREWKGVRTIFPRETTQFKFQAQGRKRTLETYLSTVQVVPTEQPLSISGRFVGVCASAVPSWTELRFDYDATWSDQVQLLGVCNPNGFAIKLILYSENQRMGTVLEANQCNTATISSFTRIVGTPLNSEISLAANCMSSPVVPPPDIVIEVGLVC